MTHHEKIIKEFEEKYPPVTDHTHGAVYDVPTAKQSEIKSFLTTALTSVRADTLRAVGEIAERMRIEEITPDIIINSIQKTSDASWDRGYNTALSDLQEKLKKLT